MRIVRVLTRPNVGGPTRQAAALFHAGGELGHRTLLVVGRCGDDEPALDLAALGLPRWTLADVLAAAARGEHPTGFVELPGLGRAVAPVADARAGRTLRRLLTALRPEVVHTHTSKAGWLGRRAAVGLGAVVAHTFHGHVLADHHGALFAAMLRALERRSARRSDLLFAVSATCRDELVAARVAPAGSISVVPPAVDVAPFARVSRGEARATLGIDVDTWLLGFVGRLVDVKAPERYAATLAALPGARGLVLGDGPRRAALTVVQERLVAAVGSRPDPWSVLPACDALVLCSRREGLPLAGVEAMAAGVPVVGLDVPGVCDLLGGGRGVLVPEGEGARGLAAALTRLRARPREAARLAVGGREVAAGFMPAAAARRLDAAYRAAAGGSQSPRSASAAASSSSKSASS